MARFSTETTKYNHISVNAFTHKMYYLVILWSQWDCIAPATGRVLTSQEGGGTAAAEDMGPARSVLTLCTFKTVWQILYIE